MTEEEFMAAMGYSPADADRRVKQETLGQLVMGIARAFVAIPLKPHEKGYAQQQELLAELQKCQDAHGFNLAAYPIHTKIILVHMLKAAGEVMDDAMAYIAVGILNGDNK